MICETCQYKTGYDECGAGNYHAYCGKGHWSGEGPQDQEEYEQQGNPDPWADCKDYQQDKMTPEEASPFWMLEMWLKGYGTYLDIEKQVKEGKLMPLMDYHKKEKK